jgi:hypothetical protein
MRRSYLGLAAAVGLVIGCAAVEEGSQSATAEASAPVVVLKEVYFGDLHIHSAWSLDAWSFGVRTTPEDSYRYVRGEAIPHASGEIQMQGPPLDFVALTEHGNYMGIPEGLLDPDDPLQRLPLIRDLLSDDAARAGSAMGRIMSHLGSDTPLQELVPGDRRAPGWKRIVDLADSHNRPGTFTAFPAYEYTSMPQGQNLHRNVVFRGSEVPAEPFSAFDSQNPEDLWDYMDAARASGSDVIAIPHNQNGSNGLMYATTDTAGRPIDDAYAEQRLRNEPVAEVMQIKGQSETHPELSPDDEWADFEILPTILGRPEDSSEPVGSYARHALKTGLEIEAAGGVNPYRFGMLGSSDGHNSSSPVEEDNYTGKLGVLDGTASNRLGLSGTSFTGAAGSSSPFSAAGLAGVWAAANTREDIFDAMRARETFATSGPRIRVQVFAGFDLSVDDLGNDMAKRGYARGVPMGGELEGARGRAPTLLVRAVRDPREAPLERLQVVKGWIEGGAAREKVFDVACADGSFPDPDSQRCADEAPPPDLSDCSYAEADGAPQLSAAWMDPEFDASERSFYYVRVLQIPTCRWSSWDALRLVVPLREDATPWLQERAVTSPIWFRPS